MQRFQRGCRPIDPTGGMRSSPWRALVGSRITFSSMVRASSLEATPRGGGVAPCTMLLQRRPVTFGGFFGSKQRRVRVLNAQYDKEAAHYTGTIFGVPADSVVFYSKVFAGVSVVFIVFSFFMKGYAWMSRFSLASVARMGFMGGFISCAIVYSTLLALRRRYRINPNAVYNHSIALVMRNPEVVQFLGPHPRTGDFKAYCATGGFKLPLMRRLRSGSYELSDLLGLKQRRLQMMFVLRNPSNGREGLVSCDVRKEMAGFMSSENTYKSLAITLTDAAAGSEPKTVVIIGKPQDVVYSGLTKL